MHVLPQLQKAPLLVSSKDLRSHREEQFANSLSLTIHVAFMLPFMSPANKDNSSQWHAGSQGLWTFIEPFLRCLNDFVFACLWVLLAMPQILALGPCLVEGY